MIFHNNAKIFFLSEGESQKLSYYTLFVVRYDNNTIRRSGFWLSLLLLVVDIMMMTVISQ